MGLSSLINRLFKPAEEAVHFQQIPDRAGLNLILDQKHFNACQQGTAEPYLQFQYIYLQSLAEQGGAEPIPNGYMVAKSALAALDEESEAALQLPGRYPGSFDTRIKGTTGQSSFNVQLIPLDQNGQPRPQFRRTGALLQFSDREKYRLTAAELLAFEALESHNPVTADAEAANLWLVGQLQQALQAGMQVNLSHFRDLAVEHPQGIGVSATEAPNGDLILTPNFGNSDDASAFASRQWQLQGEDQQAVMRIRNRIVVLDEARLRATHEIINNNRIPKAQVKTFLETPGAFLDASLIDLDLGFSMRVNGATKFTAMEFGEADESGIGWFDSPAESLVSPAQLPELLQSEEDLVQFEQRLEKAQHLGAEVVDINGQQMDISNAESTTAALESLRNEQAQGSWPKATGTQPTPEPTRDERVETERATVDLAEADTAVENLQQQLTAALEQPCSIDFSPYKRQPFPHQREGIHWFTTLAGATADSPSPLTQGALLADDMGLGKTYMSLVGISELYRRVQQHGDTCKPVLIVAPLSLLENWEDEVSVTCPDNTFRDIVVLQSNRDLKQYRIAGAGNETRQQLGDDETLAEDAIRYALKTGRHFGMERLDMDRRLVLTTFQTLRDYQFSLCRIDWSLVIFDEAQNIKNPNALQTRAAKGLKADFKLLATGTPVENSLLDYWCLMDTAQPGLLGDWSEFQDAYVKPISQADKAEQSDVRLRCGQQLRSETGHLMLRRLKEDQLEGLPAKRVFTGTEQQPDSEWYFEPTLCAAMAGEQLATYDAIIESYQQTPTEKRRGKALGTLQQLRNVSLHPRLNDESLLTSPGNANQMIGLSGKLQILQNLLTDIRQRNEKVLIFATSKKLQALLRLWLQSLYGVQISIINGETRAVASRPGAETRKGIIAQFETEPGFGILIMSPVAAGVGLTVVGANNVIHLERHWNPAKEAQATDRVYRIGQQKDVNIYLPTLHHPEKLSFDVNLDRLLNRKLGLKDAVVTPQDVQPEELDASLMQPPSTLFSDET